MTFQVGWPEDHSQALRELVLSGAGSYSEIAAELNAKFHTAYSRNACIGRAIRMGLPSNNPRPMQRKAKVATETVIRFKPKTKIELPPIGEIAQLRLRCVEIVPLNLSLMDLESSQCRWPYGDDTIVFCGHPASPGSSYCMPHYCLSIGLSANPEGIPENRLEAAE